MDPKLLAPLSDCPAVLAAMEADMAVGAGAYFAIGAAAVAISGVILHFNMGMLLHAAFNGVRPLSASANRLLLLGYGLLMSGFLTLSLPAAKDWRDYAGVFDFLRWKLGLFAIVLGLGYFGGLIACSFVCSSALQRTSNQHAE